MSSRLCKYHGRACEFPGACLNRAPRKHDSDGHVSKMDPERVRVGTLLRMVSDDGGVAPFSDTVVTGIWMEDKQGHKHTYDSIKDAQDECSKVWGEDFRPALTRGNDHRVVIELARPYMYASTIGICFNQLTGVSQHRTTPSALQFHYSAVEMSTGEYACFNERD